MSHVSSPKSLLLKYCKFIPRIVAQSILVLPFPMVALWEFAALKDWTRDHIASFARSVGYAVDFINDVRRLLSYGRIHYGSRRYRPCQLQSKPMPISRFVWALHKTIRRTPEAALSHMLLIAFSSFLYPHSPSHHHDLPSWPFFPSRPNHHLHR